MTKQEQEKLEALILWHLDNFDPDNGENAESIVPTEFDDEADFIARFVAVAQATLKEDREWQ